MKKKNANQDYPNISGLQMKKKIDLHQYCTARLKFRPGLPKLSPRFVFFPDREGPSFCRNRSFTVWVENSCYLLLLWLWLKGEKKSPDKIQWYGWSFRLNSWVCLNLVLKAKLGGYEPTWNEKVNVDLFWINLSRLHSFSYKAPKQKSISKMNKTQNNDETFIINILGCSKIVPSTSPRILSFTINLLHVSTFSQSSYNIRNKNITKLGVNLSLSFQHLRSSL